MILNSLNRLVIAFLICIAIYGCRQKLNTVDKPQVDQRVELISIVFRLADSQEYSSERFKLYTDRIQAHYQPYKNHPLIEFVKKLRKQNNIGYDAPMYMAIHLDKDLEPLVEFTEKVPDQRWGKENAREFVRLLNSFYEESKSEKFFNDNELFYRQTSERFMPVYRKLDLNWYRSFYGHPANEKFHIVNGLANGPGNYGPAINHSDGRREVYAIMGTWSTDSLGMAKFPLENYFPILLHEFNHSFVNALLEKKSNLFKKNGEILYRSVEKEMKNQAYGNWQTMLNEALVRAAVIKYMKDHDFDPQQIQKETNAQLSRGFFWIQDLVTELEKYDTSRKEYSTLDEYILKIADAYMGYAKNIDTYKQDFDKKRPKVITISEFSNGDRQVSPTLKKVTISFDQPLTGEGYSFNYGEKGQAAFPAIENVTYSEDKKSIFIEWNLESHKEYQLVLTGVSFKNSKDVAINDYPISFKTE
jgi:hypothetical protein